MRLLYMRPVTHAREGAETRSFEAEERERWDGKDERRDRGRGEEEAGFRVGGHGARSLERF